jgi:hypothetical protein
MPPLERRQGKTYWDRLLIGPDRYGVWQVPGGITRPWDFRRGRSATVIPDGTTPGGRRYRCSEIGSYARAHELLRQGHTYLYSNGDGEACESLR